jgi:hypothetical protein
MGRPRSLTPNRVFTPAEMAVRAQRAREWYRNNKPHALELQRLRRRKRRMIVSPSLRELSCRPWHADTSNRRTFQ